jgi:hypothetical protein
MDYFFFPGYFPSNSILTVMDYFLFSRLFSKQQYFDSNGLFLFSKQQYFDSNGLFFIFQVIFQETVF